MTKRILSLALGLATLLLAVALSACASKQTLSGTYVSTDDSSVYLVFDDKTVTIYEDGTETDSGEYRFYEEDAIIFSFSKFAGSYTLDENKENLYYGSADDDKVGEIAFTKKK